MWWILLLLITTISWASYDLLFKKLGEQVNYFLALLIIGLFQILLAVPFVIYYSNKSGLDYTTKGFIITAIMGILLGLGTVFFFYTFKYGAPASVAIPVYCVGVAILGGLGGLLFFKEAFT